MVASPGAWSSPGGGSPASARSRSPSNVGSPNRNGSDGGGGDPSCRVSVAVRIRPLLGQELSDGSVECITTDECDRKQVRELGLGWDGEAALCVCRGDWCA